MQLVSQPGLGTTFTVYFPVFSGAAAEAGAGEQESSDGWQGSGTILLAEDEEQIRMLAKIMLQMLGFTVIEAVNGREALELYKERNAEITVVLTDIGMPVMDGYELIRELKKLSTKLPIIISSGFGDVNVTSKLAGDEIDGLISKPYKYEELRVVLKRVTGNVIP